MKVNLVGPGYTGRSKSLNAARCINLYPEIDTQDGKNVTALIGTPGTELFSNTGTDIIRGMHVFNGLIYFVSQSSLYSLDGGGNVTGPLGSSLTTVRGRVSMVNNGLSPTGGDEVVIADGDNIYVWDVIAESTTIIGIEADTICFVKGRFIANSGGGKFRTSGLYDGTSWNALDVATAEAAPDELLAVFSNNGELWLLGEYTTEIWYSVSTGNPPFDPVSGGVIDYGCAARFSIASGDNALIWLGTKRNNDQGEFIGVCMARGYGVEVISPASINAKISKYAVINDAFAYCYTEGGHEFYVLTFPSANATWVYDTTTRLWHERSSYENDPYAVGRHRGNCYAYYNNRHYVGDYENGNIYEMDSDIYDENGDPLVSQRIFPHLADKETLGNIFYQQLELDAEKGGGFKSIAERHFYDTKNADLDTRTYDSVRVGAYIYLTDYTNSKLIKLNASTLAIVGSIAVGATPCDMDYLFDYLWVSNNAGGTISKVDPDTFLVVATIPVGTYPRKAIEGGDYVWIPNTGSNNVTRINPTTNETLTVTLLSGLGPAELAYYDGYVWTRPNSSPAELDKINASTGVCAASYDYGGTAKNIIFYSGYLQLYMNEGLAGKIRQINPADGVIIDSVDVTYNGYALVTGNNRLQLVNDFLWVLNEHHALVEKINLSVIGAMTKDAEISIGTTGDNPRAVIYALDYLWVVLNGQNKVVQINVLLNEVVAHFSIANDCRMLASDDDSVFIPGEDSFYRIVKTEKEPQAILSWSDDGGYTWSNDYLASLGKRGEYSKRTQWRRLGRSRNRVFRLAIADGIKKVLNSAVLKFTGGT